MRTLLFLSLFFVAPVYLFAQDASVSDDEATTTQEEILPQPTTQQLDPNKPIVQFSEPQVGIDLDGRLTESEYDELLEGSREFLQSSLVLKKFELGYVVAVNTKESEVFFTTVDGTSFFVSTTTPMTVFRNGFSEGLQGARPEDILTFVTDTVSIIPVSLDRIRGQGEVRFYINSQTPEVEELTEVDTATTSSSSVPTTPSNAGRTEIVFDEDISVVRNGASATLGDVQIQDRVWLLEENGEQKILVARGPDPQEPYRAEGATFTQGSSSLPSWFFWGGLAIGGMLIVVLISFFRNKRKSRPKKQATGAQNRSNTIPPRPRQ